MAVFARAESLRSRAGAAAALLALCLALALTAGASAARPNGPTTFAPLDSGQSPSVSSNWAGYAITGTASTGVPTAFTNVTGTWTVPRPTCAGEASFSAFWIGLGGFSETSQALEQIGSESNCTASGTSEYSLWYEIVPAPPVTIRLKVAARDTITGAVLVRGTEIVLQVTNRTRHTRFTQRTVMGEPDLSSAEWIAEAPSACSRSGRCRTLPLANFGSVKFSRAAATGDDHAGTITDAAWTATPITLAENGLGGLDARFRPVPTAPTTGAVPSNPTPDGRGFTVAWADTIRS